MVVCDVGWLGMVVPLVLEVVFLTSMDTAMVHLTVNLAMSGAGSSRQETTSAA